MDEFALGFVLVALGTPGRVGVFVQRHGMDAGKEQTGAGEKGPPHKNPHNSGHNVPPRLT
jgi:hypothetical protein